MTTLKFDMENVQQKIDGRELVTDVAKIHESWLPRIFEYGLRRFINDTHSQLSGNEKWEACLDFASKTLREPKPEKVMSVKPKLSPVEALAVKMAKERIKRLWEKSLGETPTVKRVVARAEQLTKAGLPDPMKFYTESGIWKDAVVLNWIMENRDAYDFLADAKKELEKDEIVAAKFKP